MKQPKRILVIRRDNIGDLVCTTPAIAALRAHYPGAEIAALVNSYNAEVLRGNPNVDRVFVYQKLKHAGGMLNQVKALCERIKLITQLRRWKPDATILAKSSYDMRGFNFARQIGAKNIIGYVLDDLAKAKSLPDVRLKTPEYAAIHEVEAVNQMLKPLGIENPPGPLQVYPEPGAVASIQSRLPKAAKRIALHISAREPERRWGNDNFIAFAKHILGSHPDIQILLFWAPGKADDPHHPGDDDVAERLINAVRDSRVVPMPTHNLTELIAALSLGDLFVGADGGALHLAAGLGIKVLALFENRPEKVNHWYPWMVSHEIVCSEDKSHPNVSEVAVLNFAKKFDLLINSQRLN